MITISDFELKKSPNAQSPRVIKDKKRILKRIPIRSAFLHQNLHPLLKYQKNAYKIME